MKNNLTQAVEDYLKLIYVLNDEYGRASTNQIAERMGVKPASVTGMLQKMAANEPPLVDYQKHHGVVLTDAGQTAALEIIRHHRLLELFLVETLGYSWDEVHNEADRLEHVISEDFEERIAQALGDPQRDPHGEPIPSRDFRLPLDSTVRLSELRAGQEAVVQRVEPGDADMLRHLENNGLVPLARVRVLSYSAFDGNLHLKIEGQDETVVVLGPQVTRRVFVEM